ncbi:uncharacterized protein LOC129768491 [Toxorhynchites rutilus septentrionalis]|uniref:uncharacterized protein LOC129768491 n=1 Tax=Toxorhynchites rutilus septentrionalis TaxID=329112 RepID=UPI002478B15C|nr:uncharacterized protein LOC129768491 [Toxorhynchites rutilus septentrionalis]
MDDHPGSRDNGAKLDGPLAPVKKPSKKRILKELRKALDMNNDLQEQVANLTAERDTCIGKDFHQASSNTIREDSLFSTINNWTLGSLNIPECSPSDGETEIDKRAFEYWKDILVSSLQLINAADEQTKFGIFKIKSGPKLREIFHTTSSAPGMPDEKTAPFANALARLDEYYGSRTYMLSQRGRLMMMSQGSSENSITFVQRVASAAKLCNYGPDEEMEAVVRVVTKGASDGRIRVLAHRNWVKQGTIKDLIDLVRDREIEKSNEEEFQRIHGRGEPLVAAVSNGSNEFSNHRGTYHGRGRGFARPNRGRGGRGSFRGNQRRDFSSNCWRCGSVYHRASNCFAIDRECRVCSQMGHIARVCPSNTLQDQRRFLKRQADQEPPVDRKVAAIECEKSETELNTKVREVEDIE